MRHVRELRKAALEDDPAATIPTPLELYASLAGRMRRLWATTAALTADTNAAKKRVAKPR